MVKMQKNICIAAKIFIAPFLTWNSIRHPLVQICFFDSSVYVS